MKWNELRVQSVGRGVLVLRSLGRLKVHRPCVQLFGNYRSRGRYFNTPSRISKWSKLCTSRRDKIKKSIEVEKGNVTTDPRR